MKTLKEIGNEALNTAVEAAVAEITRKVNEMVSPYGYMVSGPIDKDYYDTEEVWYVLDSCSIGCLEVVYKYKEGKFYYTYMCGDWRDCENLETAVREWKLYKAWDEECTKNNRMKSA